MLRWRSSLWVLAILLLPACGRFPPRAIDPSTVAVPGNGGSSPVPTALVPDSEAKGGEVPTSIPIFPTEEESPIVTSPTPAFHQLREITSLGGATTSVAVAGDYVLAGIGTQLVALTGENEDLRRVSDLEMPGLVRDISVTDNHIYVAVGDQGICTIDRSPVDDLTLESCHPVPGAAVAIEAQEPYVYVAAGLGGLQVLELSDTGVLLEVGAYTNIVRAVDLAVRDTIIYLAVSGWDGISLTGDNGVVVVDVSQPQQPTPRSFFDTGGGPVTQVELQGTYLHTVTGWEKVPGADNRVRTLRAHGPNQLAESNDLYVGIPIPVLITMSTDSNWRAFGIVQQCDYIGSGDCRGGLAIVERREDDYGSLTLGEAICADCSWNGTAEDAVLIGQHLYVAAGSAGLRVYDVTVFPEMSYLGSFSYPLQGEIVDVDVTGERGLVAAKSEGVRVVDVTNPWLPSEIGFYRSPDTVIRSVVAKDELAYAAATTGLKILDISTGSNPEAIGSLATAGFCWGVAVDDNYAYLSVVESTRVSGDADALAGLWVVDVRDPTSPIKVGGYPDLAGFPSDPSVAQDYLFTTDFVVVDLTVPTALRPLGALPISGLGFRAVAIAGQYAYVAAGSGGVLVIDIRAPMTPVEVGRYEMLPAANDVRIVDGYAYVAAGDAGLSVLNVANPSRLIEVARVNTPGYAHSVQILQDSVYVADGLAGLAVLSH